jgi:hypothetical protein
MVSHRLKFSVVSGSFAVSRLAAGAAIPDWIRSGTFSCVTRTSDELSVVSLAASIPAEVQSEKGWACLKLQGPFPFQLTGILASFLDPLAQAGIPIFAVSTFDTDYILVKDEHKERTLAALIEAGHELTVA